MQTLTNTEVARELPQVARLITVDAMYGVVDSNYLRESFIPWFKEWSRSSGLCYASEAKDCDKFARAFAAQAHFSAWRRQSQYAAAIGWMGVTDKGGHALNFARIQTGWVEIEPQTGDMRPMRNLAGSIIYAVL
jgi:hypothetical protein